MSDKNFVLRLIHQKQTLRFEGGFTDKKADGQVTLFGMTAKAYADFIKLPADQISFIETNFRSLAAHVNPNGTDKKGIDAKTADILAQYRDASFSMWKKMYLEEPKFNQLTSPVLQGVIADMSYHGGASSALWVMARAAQQNGYLKFDGVDSNFTRFDPSIAKDPITQKIENPYLQAPQKIRDSAIAAIEKMAGDRGVEFVIEQLAASKQEAHNAQIAQLKTNPDLASEDPAKKKKAEERLRKVEGWQTGFTNRLKEYSELHQAIKAAQGTGKVLVSDQIPSFVLISDQENPTQSKVGIKLDSNLARAQYQCLYAKQHTELSRQTNTDTKTHYVTADMNDVAACGIIDTPPSPKTINDLLQRN